MRGGGSDKANAMAAIDLLLNLLMLFVVVSAIAVAQMNRPSQEKSIEPKAELVIELTWADLNFDDLDLWVMLPGGDRVGFTHPDAGVASLDRDDRGGFGDTYVGEGGERKLIAANKETTVIRANVAGRYAVNVHYFHRYAPADIGVPEQGRPADPVVVTMTKLNPRLAEVARQAIQLGKVGSQRTAFCFDLDAAGAVSNVDTACDVPFIPVPGEPPRRGV